MPPKRKKGRPLGSKNKKPLRVKVKTENNDNVICCTSCNESFDSKSDLDVHQNICKEEIILQNVRLEFKPSYHCEKCNKRFKFKKSYTEHLTNEHSTSPGSIPCKQCNVVCPDANILENHVIRFHNGVLFECEHCGKTFTRQSHVLRHMSQKGCDGRDKINYPCEICDKTFTRKDNLMVHLRLKHIEKREFNCKHCDYCTKNFSRLIRHVQTSHTEIPHFECDHCGKVTGSRAAISKHLEIHGDKKFKCDVCGYSSFTIEVMRRHVLTHVLEKPFKCSVCKRSYIQKQQLQRHMLKHTGHICAQCGLCFESKNKFIAHCKKHLNSKELLCPFDGCVYASKKIETADQYSDHMKMHIDGKQYRCEVCSKRFNSETYLRRHVSTHALERPRRCMYCVTARAYVRGEQLVRHVRKSHPAVFRERLKHVRSVLGSNMGFDRVKKSELESILNVLDAESDRILQDYGFGVLYGGLQEQAVGEADEEPVLTEKDSPLMSEEELADNVKKLLSQLIDHETLEVFGWPDETVDTVLEKVIVHCGARAADRDKWSRVQRLRENTKHLFVYVVEDKNIARMLASHTIDQVIAHILRQVANDDQVKMEQCAA